MIGAILGLASFFLALFTVGAFMEGDLAKMGKFGGGLAACLVLILVATSPRPASNQQCSIDWDGRANTEVCD